MGVGLRRRQLVELLHTERRAPWYEVVPEAFARGGRLCDRALEVVAAQGPVIPHGVSMDLGGEDPVGGTRLDELADLDATRIERSLSSLSGPFGADGALRAYQHDPRRGDGAAARCTLLIARTRHGTLRVIEVDADMIAAWGLLQGEVSREALAARGLDEARIARGSAALERALM